MKDLRTLVWAGDQTLSGLTPELLIVDADPNGTLVAASGSLAVDPATGTMYVKTGTDSTSWSAVGGGAGMMIAIQANLGANLTITGANFPNAPADIGNLPRGRRRVDTTNCTQVRVICAVITASASANGPRLYPQVANALIPTAWTTLGAGTVVSGDAIDLGTVTVDLQSATDWIDLDANVGDLVYRIASDGGDSSSGFAITHCELEFR